LGVCIVLLIVPIIGGGGGGMSGGGGIPDGNTTASLDMREGESVEEFGTVNGFAVVDKGNLTSR